MYPMIYCICVCVVAVGKGAGNNVETNSQLHPDQDVL